ncbi:4Fe-4S cluster-binding domain-containing protein [Streptomyces sp. SHP 1-2]|uniref:4Fe-4S cluster-binding domain-containing protein n=1 Tax=Streptomyces sp. SHP 1-2 TaxID=2769489 RepID=UPI0022371B45|nr:4Fe-4S cluster-binding domain-containing protein [Streptomyces sp. SHP 1-2]
MEVRISGTHYPLETLGPGPRLGVWFQGCTLACPGCMSRHTWDGRGGGARSVADVLELWSAALAAGARGLTVSGGEPLQQPEALAALLSGAAGLRDAWARGAGGAGRDAEPRAAPREGAWAAGRATEPGRAGDPVPARAPGPGPGPTTAPTRLSASAPTTSPEAAWTPDEGGTPAGDEPSRAVSGPGGTGSRADLLVYTGYEPEELTACQLTALEHADAVVTGRFRVAEPTPLVWRGSANQRLRPLTPLGAVRYAPHLRRAATGRRLQPVTVPGPGGRTALRLYGVPLRGELAAAERALRGAGVSLRDASWRP